jgi:hypothetical protein
MAKSSQKTLEVEKIDVKTEPKVEDKVEVRKILPVRVSDADRLSILLAQEKVKRAGLEVRAATAELQISQSKLTSAQQEQAKVEAEEVNILRQVWARYDMNVHGDQFDRETGLITRVAIPSPEALKPN